MVTALQGVPSSLTFTDEGSWQKLRAKSLNIFHIRIRLLPQCEEECVNVASGLQGTHSKKSKTW